jgi:glycine cleavage system H protein
MLSIPKELRYTKDHEWVRESSDPLIVEVGITDYAQGELGDVVFVELPKASAQFKQRDVFGTIEAVKAVSELYSPVAGTIVEANKALEGDPALVNRDPYGKGWMVKVKVKDAKELEGLLRADAYAKHVGE